MPDNHFDLYIESSRYDHRSNCTATCRAMAPMVNGLEAKYYGRIKFNFLDADDPRTNDIQSTLGFRYKPEIYLLDGNGQLLKKWVGYTTQEQFEEVFARYLQ